MLNPLKQAFFQVFTLTSLWVALLGSLFLGEQTISMTYLANFVGIGTIAGVLFGVMYNALWNHFTLKPFWNVLICSILNIAGGMAAIRLFSKVMYDTILPWLPGMIVLSVVLHILAFYFYARIEIRKRAEELNKMIK